jgi:hypothetical protein
VADKILNTRVYIAGLGRRSQEIDHVEIEDTAYQASETINAAVAGEKEFVHFKLANGGAMGIKLSPDPPRFRSSAQQRVAGALEGNLWVASRSQIRRKPL